MGASRQSERHSATSPGFLHLFINSCSCNLETNHEGCCCPRYGGPEVLKFEEYPDPVPGSGEVLVRVAATGVNPIDYKRRAGLTKDFYPINFQGLMGVDTAGTVVMAWVRSGRLFPMRPGVCNGSGHTRRTLCWESRDSGESFQGTRFDPGGVVPLLTTIGNQLISATGIKAAGPCSSQVLQGMSDVRWYSSRRNASQIVIAAVLKRQVEDANTAGAEKVVATDDDTVIANLPPRNPT